MLYKTSLLLLLLLIMINAEAQKTKLRVAKANTASASNLQLQKKLDSIFSSFNKSTPGVAVTVIDNGKVLAKKAYGMASLEHNVPFTHNSVLRLPYSEGREFISIATVLMEREGILNLEDKVHKYFPKLPVWSEPVTVHDLLNHSSGFADEWATLLLTQASMSNRFDAAQFLNFLYTQPKPEIEPGKGYMYCNSDFGLLKMILEKASGENLRTWMKKKMFDPLGMKSTLLHDDKNEVIKNFALEYQPSGNEKFRSWTGDKTSPGGNYYIATSANDLERWATAHADQNSNIAKATARLLNNARLMPGADKNYVFGLKHRDAHSTSIIAHQGVSDRTYITRVPSKGLTVIVIGNNDIEHHIFHKEILDHVLATSSTPFINKKFEKTPVQYSQQALEQFTGRYIDEDTLTYESFVKDKKNILDFIILNDSLKWRYNKTEIIPLVPISKNVFKDPDYEVYIEFIPSSNGSMKINTHAHHQNKIYKHIRKKLYLSLIHI